MHNSQFRNFAINQEDAAKREQQDQEIRAEELRLQQEHEEALAEERERLNDVRNQSYLELQLATIHIDTIQTKNQFSPLEMLFFCHG